jgi:putative hemolysin
MMETVIIVLTVALGLVVPVLSALTFALRDFSYARLEEMLERQKRPGLITEMDEHQQRLLIVMSTLRMLALLGVVICFVYWCERFGTYGMLAAFVLSLVYGLLLGIAVPHLWAQHGADVLLCWTLPLLRTLRMIFWPLVGWMLIFDNPIRRIAGTANGPPETPAEKVEKEILDALQEGDEEGTITERERRMICGVIELRETEVGAVMTPRTEMVCVAISATLAEVKEIIRKEGHSRIPVYEENIDTLLGVLYAKDLLNIAPDQPFDLRELMRKVPFIPENKSVLDLLREFQSSKVHVAIVLDEYGGTAGLVSFEDILEQVVGEIEDEYEEPQPEPIKRISEDVVEVDARVHVDELNRELGIELPEDDAYETIGGFVFSTLGKIPEAGEEFAYQNVRIRVTDAEARRINRLRLHVLRQEQEA